MSFVKYRLPFIPFILLVVISIIFCMGLVMIYNTFSAEVLDLDLNKNLHQSFLRQIVYACVGIVTAAAVWWMGYHRILQWSFPALLFLLLLLVLILLPGIGQIINGARRWIRLGSFSMQPSEFVKFALPLCYLYYVSLNKTVREHLPSFLKLVLKLLLPIVLILLEPDIVTAGLLSMTLLVLFFLTGVRMRFWAIPTLVFLLLVSVAATQFSYARARIDVYLHPEKDLQGKGHQPYQAKIAAGSGQLTGKGLGKSVQKLNYLPEAQNDYIAAIFAEEFGFLGMLGLIGLYMVFIYCGYYIASHAPDRIGCFVAITVTFIIAVQAFLNLGVVSGLLPSKGLNLPFFSQGGTNLIANFIGIGLLLSVSHTRQKKELDYQYIRIL